MKNNLRICKKITLVLLSLLFINVNLLADVSTKTTLLARLNQATVQYKLAVDSGFAWSKTASILASAKLALEEGELAKSEMFIDKVFLQANASLKQAEESKKNWQGNSKLYLGS